MGKSAVEFLESEIKKLVYIAKSNEVKFDELFEQAKAMEEDEAQKAYLYWHEVGFMKAKEHELNKSE